MRTALTIALCLCLLTFAPQGGCVGGVGGGALPAAVKANNCLNSSSDGSGNVVCKSYSTDKSGILAEDNMTDEDSVEDGDYQVDGSSVSKDQFSRSARVPSHQFMRFGRDHKFLRFGRDVQHKFMRFGRGFGDIEDDESQLSHKFFRFGRGDPYGDYNRGDIKHQFLRFGKSDSDGMGHKFLRFGKKSSNDADEEGDNSNPEEGDYLEEMNDGEDAADENLSRTIKSEHKFLRFGRAPAVKGHAFMRFGRKPKTTAHNFMRFGRIPEHNFFRFGRSGSSLAFKAPKSTSIAPVIPATSPIDNNVELAPKNSYTDRHSLIDSNFVDNGMKLKRDGHLFMRFGRN